MNSNLECSFFFFNDTATTEIYTLSLHDALPISMRWHHDEAGVGQIGQQGKREPRGGVRGSSAFFGVGQRGLVPVMAVGDQRSEEHTSELQSQSNLVCRLLLEKKNTSTSHFCTSA